MNTLSEPISLASVHEFEHLVEMAEDIRSNADRMETQLGNLRLRQTLVLMVLHVALVLLAILFDDANAWRWAAAPVAVLAFFQLWFDGWTIARLRRDLTCEVYLQNRVVETLRETQKTHLDDASTIRKALIEMRLHRFPSERRTMRLFRS